jgi:hypothetical protein
MSTPQTLQEKLERLEILVDALLEERRGLREDLKAIEARMRSLGKESHASEVNGEEFMKTLDDLRRKLSESEAANQNFLRERNQVRERLEQLLARLDMIEDKTARAESQLKPLTGAMIWETHSDRSPWNGQRTTACHCYDHGAKLYPSCRRRCSVCPDDRGLCG